ncbi:hypothetical protein TIFTF001_020839 [Ficus carica]|uniref:Protein kinase domain-containing protein n=1 Tax=Ficus carica TaxID=3494 RepID=A0AA88AUG0_FICCA|nr:hypothetical protein TIFTF001_020839 [Ficus carica]
MAVSSLCLYFLITAAAVLGRASQEDCVDYSGCGEPKDFHIRFPFRLKDKQPNDCGYPGFNLYCTSDNQIAIELPKIPVELHVSFIDYISQIIHVNIPEFHAVQFKKSVQEYFLDPTNSPFAYGLSRCTLMNCSGNPFPCASDCLIPNDGGSRYGNLCAVYSDGIIKDHPEVIWCSKMYNFFGVPTSLVESTDTVLYFSLRWSEPSCTRCERQQKGCRLKRPGTDHETECFTFNKHGKGPWTKSLVTIGLIMGSFVVLLMSIAAFYVHASDKNEKENRLRIKKFLEDYIALRPARYSYTDIKKITNQFRDKLGQGAYGTVFKGKLSNNVLIAVKILNNTKGNGEEFINEVATMGQIHHVNVVRLVGYCADGFRRALVYEFLPNDSLDKYISHAASDTNYSLSWEKLQNIALRTAKGIEYLHQGCDQRILHFDIKPHNILLDKNFSPKISDFGLAKLCSKDQSTVSMSTARGTMGYIAPEVFSRNFGNVSYKADVYSFGMLLLEMVGRRKINTDAKEENGAHEVYYPEWIYNLLEEGEDLRIQIEGEEDAKIAKKLAIVGLWCIQWHPIGRPTMKVVVQMLERGEDLAMPPNPFASTGPSKTMTKRPARRSPLEFEAIAE